MSSSWDAGRLKSPERMQPGGDWLRLLQSASRRILNDLLRRAVEFARERRALFGRNHGRSRRGRIVCAADWCIVFGVTIHERRRPKRASREFIQYKIPDPLGPLPHVRDELRNPTFFLERIVFVVPGRDDLVEAVREGPAVFAARAFDQEILSAHLDVRKRMTTFASPKIGEGHGIFG